MFLRHFGQLRDITWLADQRDFELQQMKAEKIDERMGLSELEFDRMSKLESMLSKFWKRSSSVKELGNRERSDQVRKDVEQGIELESEINAHRTSKEDEDNFIRIAKLDCKMKKESHHFKILEDTAAKEYWVDRGKFIWEEQMQDSVVESQMKRDSARKAESERASSSKSVGRIFREDEKKNRNFFGRRSRLIRENDSGLRTKPEILLPRPRSDWQDWRWLKKRN